MALPSSGQISAGDIRTEFSSSGRNNYSFSQQMNGSFSGPLNDGYTPINQGSFSKPNPTNPDAISEWYNYNHSTFTSCNDIYTLSPGACSRTYRIILITGGIGLKALISVTGDDNNSAFTYRIYDVYPFTNTGALVATSPIFSGNLSTTTNTHLYTLSDTYIYLHFVAYQNDCV